MSKIKFYIQNKERGSKVTAVIEYSKKKKKTIQKHKQLVDRLNNMTVVQTNNDCTQGNPPKSKHHMFFTEFVAHGNQLEKQNCFYKFDCESNFFIII